MEVQTEKIRESESSIQEQIEKYLIHWKWFVLTIILALAMAFLYLRYATPQFRASTSIAIKDDKRGGGASEFAAFSDKGLLGTGKNNIDNEIEVLKSRTLIEKLLLI